MRCQQNTANNMSSAKSGRKPIARYGLFPFIAKECANKPPTQRLNCIKRERNALQNAFRSFLLFFYTSSRMTISAASPRRGPFLMMRV